MKLNKINICIFILFSFYLFLGITGSYYNTTIFERNDIFYDADIKNYGLFPEKIQIGLDRHPFVFILFPFLKALNLIICDTRLTLLSFQAAIAVLNNILLFTILKRLSIRRSTSAFFTLIYAFSFSTLFFVSFPEIYLYSSCIGLLLTYCILSDRSPAFKTPVVALLCLCGFGINTINIVLYIPLLFYYFSQIKPTREKISSLKIFFISFGLMFSSFFLAGEFIYSVSSSVFSASSLAWLDLDFSAGRFMKIFWETFIAPFYALNTDYIPQKKSLGWYFADQQSPLYLIPFIIMIVASNLRKSFTKAPAVIYIFIGTVLLHTVLNCFYNITWFLYSQNYLFLFVAFMAYLHTKTDEKLQAVVLSFFLGTQIILNFKMLYTLFTWSDNPFLYFISSTCEKIFLMDLLAVCLFIIVKPMINRVSYVKSLFVVRKKNPT